MKNLLFLILAFILLRVGTCHAQDTDFKKPVVRANKQSYNTSESILHHKIINNINNHLYKSKNSNVPKNAIPPKLSDKRYDRGIVAQIFYDTFPEAQLKQLANEDLDMQIRYAVDHQGNVLEISFSFADNSSLKPSEIEQLEDRLKKEIKFTLNNTIFKGYNYIPVTSFVNFKRLVNHTADAVQ